MLAALTVLDDLLSAHGWEHVRRLAQEAPYQTVAHPVDGKLYKNVGEPPDGFSLDRVISGALTVPVFETLQFFRRGEPGDGAGNIHCDNGDGDWASVLYLNSREELAAVPHGTAFWSHKWLKSDRLLDPTDPDLVALVNADRDDPEKWHFEFAVPARENRMIIYPSIYFHSRWPLEPAAGRLVHCSFFRTVVPHVASQ